MLITRLKPNGQRKRLTVPSYGIQSAPCDYLSKPRGVASVLLCVSGVTSIKACLGCYAHQCVPRARLGSSATRYSHPSLMEQEVKREPDIEDCLMPGNLCYSAFDCHMLARERGLTTATLVVESPTSTPAATPALALPSATNGQSTLTAAGIAGVMLERRDRAFYLTGTSSHHRSEAHSSASPQPGGSGMLSGPVVHSTNIAAQREGVPTKRALQQRYRLVTTHTHWWLEYPCELGRFRFTKPKYRPANEPTRYKCAECKGSAYCG